MSNCREIICNFGSPKWLLSIEAKISSWGTQKPFGHWWVFSFWLTFSLVALVFAAVSLLSIFSTFSSVSSSIEGMAMNSTAQCTHSRGQWWKWPRKSWKIPQHIRFPYDFFPASAIIYHLWPTYHFFRKFPTHSLPWWTWNPITFQRLSLLRVSLMVDSTVSLM